MALVETSCWFPMFGLLIGDSGSACFLRPKGVERTVCPLFTSMQKAEEFVMLSNFPCSVKNLRSTAAIRQFVQSPPLLGKPGPAAVTDVVVDPQVANGDWYTVAEFLTALGRRFSPETMAQRLVFPTYVFGSKQMLAVMDQGEEGAYLVAFRSKELASKFASSTHMPERMVQRCASASDLLWLIDASRLPDEVEVWTNESIENECAIKFSDRFPMPEFKAALRELSAFESKRDLN